MDTTKNAIEVTNLVKRYKELVALDHFNLTVKTGEIFIYSQLVVHGHILHDYADFAFDIVAV